MFLFQLPFGTTSLLVSYSPIEEFHDNREIQGKEGLRCHHCWRTLPLYPRLVLYSPASLFGSSALEYNDYRWPIQYSCKAPYNQRLLNSGGLGFSKGVVSSLFMTRNQCNYPPNRFQHTQL